MDNNTIGKLKQGDFSNILLNRWFSECDFEYIFAILEGLKNKRNRTNHTDIFIFNYIIVMANQLLNKPVDGKYNKDTTVYRIRHAEKYPEHENRADLFRRDDSYLIDRLSKDIINSCTTILIGATDLYVNDVYLRANCENPGLLSSSSSDLVRLNFCSHGKYTNDYLNDPSPRIRKVANIINNYNINYKNDEFEESLLFIDNALNLGIIEYSPEYNIDMWMEYEKANVRFSSMMFKEDVTVHGFDVDVLQTIKDKLIFTWEVRELINEGILQFKPELMPACFSYLFNNNVLTRTLIPKK